MLLFTPEGQPKKADKELKKRQILLRSIAENLKS